MVSKYCCPLESLGESLQPAGVLTPASPNGDLIDVGCNLGTGVFQTFQVILNSGKVWEP